MFNEMKKLSLLVKVLFLVIFILGMSSVAMAADPEASEDATVCASGCTYTTIADAISGVSVGDVIEVTEDHAVGER